MCRLHSQFDMTFDIHRQLSNLLKPPWAVRASFKAPEATCRGLRKAREEAFHPKKRSVPSNAQGHLGAHCTPAPQSASGAQLLPGGDSGYAGRFKKRPAGPIFPKGAGSPGRNPRRVGMWRPSVTSHVSRGQIRASFCLLGCSSRWACFEVVSATLGAEPHHGGNAIIMQNHVCQCYLGHADCS